MRIVACKQTKQLIPLIRSMQSIIQLNTASHGCLKLLLTWICSWHKTKKWLVHLCSITEVAALYCPLTLSEHLVPVLQCMHKRQQAECSAFSCVRAVALI